MNTQTERKRKKRGKANQTKTEQPTYAAKYQML